MIPQTVIEWGYLGGAAWAVLLFGGIGKTIRRAFRHRRDLSFPDQVAFACQAGSLLSVVLHALVDFPLQVPSIQLYAVVLLGVFWGSRRWLARPEERPSRRRTATPAREVHMAP